MAFLEEYFTIFVRGCILLIELAGIAVIVISMFRGFIGYMRRDVHTRIQLAQGIMLGLEFKIGSEVLRSVIVSGWNELGTLAAIILLRSLLTLLLHWEIDAEEKRVEASQNSALKLATSERKPGENKNSGNSHEPDAKPSTGAETK